METRWKRIRWLCFIASVLMVGHRTHNSHGIGFDQARQIGIARSLIDGHGFSIPFVNPNDFSEKQHVSMATIYPPGYSLILVPFLKIFNDAWWMTLVINWMTIIVVFLSWLIISESLGVTLPIPARIFLWCFWSFVYDPLTLHRNFEGATDALALAFFSSGLATCSLMIMRNKDFVPLGAVSGLLAGSSAAIRFAYWPLIGVLPLSLYLCAYKYERRLFRAGHANLLAGICVLAPVIIFMLRESGPTRSLSIFQMPHVAHGLFWNHLLRLWPFPADAIGFYEAWKYLWIHRLHGRNAAVAPACGVAATLIFAAFVADLIYQHRAGTKISPSPQTALRAFFSFSACLTMATTLAMLACLAVRYKFALGENPIWVYINERRYYIVTLNFFLISVASFLWSKEVGPAAKLLKGALCGLLGIASVNIYLSAVGAHKSLTNPGIVQFRANVEPRACLDHLRKYKSLFPLVYIEDQGKTFAMFRGWHFQILGVPVAGPEMEIVSTKPVEIILGRPRDKSQRASDSMDRLMDVYKAQPLIQIGEMDYYHFIFRPSRPVSR